MNPPKTITVYWCPTCGHVRSHDEMTNSCSGAWAYRNRIRNRRYRQLERQIEAHSHPPTAYMRVAYEPCEEWYAARAAQPVEADCPTHGERVALEAARRADPLVVALRQIADYEDHMGGPPPDDAMREIARKALQP